MSTVPHSGTRYIRDSISEEGYSVVKVRGPHPEETDLIWGHFDSTNEDWMVRIQPLFPDLRHFVVVRNPIHTLCTHYADTNSILGVSNKVRDRGRDEIIGRMYRFYTIQDAYIKQYSPYIHRVEDPIASLGDWLGIGLKGTGGRYSRPNELREAVNSRDVDQCFQIAGPVWEWFVQECSDRIAPLYRDKLGYDYWWLP